MNQPQAEQDQLAFDHDHQQQPPIQIQQNQVDNQHELPDEQQLPHLQQQADDSDELDDHHIENQCLRIATINCGRATPSKISAILKYFEHRNVHMIAISEYGNPGIIEASVRSAGWMLSSNPRANAGVALLYRQSLYPFYRKRFKDKDGRLIGEQFEFQPGHLTLIISAYVPTGRDGKERDLSKQYEDATNTLYRRIHSWSQEANTCIIAGDLNQTIAPIDRNSPVQALIHNQHRWIHSLIQANFIDTFRHTHPNESGHTFSWQNHTTQQQGSSRLDYIFIKSSREIQISRSRVEPFMVRGGHCAVLSDIIMHMCIYY